MTHGADSPLGNLDQAASEVDLESRYVDLAAAKADSGRGLDLAASEAISVMRNLDQLVIEANSARGASIWQHLRPIQCRGKLIWLAYDGKDFLA